MNTIFQNNKTISEASQLRYAHQLTDARWLSLRKEILHRDGHACRHCDSKNSLQIHHRQYHVHSDSGAWKAPWDYAPALLLTLCERCHKAGHENYTVPVFSIKW